MIRELATLRAITFFDVVVLQAKNNLAILFTLENKVQEHTSPHNHVKIGNLRIKCNYHAKNDTA